MELEILELAARSRFMDELMHAGAAIPLPMGGGTDWLIAVRGAASPILAVPIKVAAPAHALSDPIAAGPDATFVMGALAVGSILLAYGLWRRYRRARPNLHLTPR